MNKKYLTEETVEQEIAMLKTSKYVALAQRADEIKYRRRQLLDNLRDLEKRGKAIAEQMQNEGIDILNECFEDEFDYA